MRASGRSTFYFAMALILPSVGCRTSRSVAIPNEESSAVVRAYIAAYNRHDGPAVVALLDSNMTWFSVEGDSVRVEVRGRMEIERSMRAYLTRLLSARSEIDAITVLGSWVTVNERATWQSTAGFRQQASVSVYEVSNRKIRRVWYYPVVPQ